MFAGCNWNGASNGASPTSGQGVPKTTLVYARGGDANTLDPINTDIGESVKILVNVFDTLVAYHDETEELVPGLATSWEHSEDGLVWRFRLREEVTFHDGEPFNADAVVFSFERLLADSHPGLFDKARPYQPSYRMIERVERESDYLVAFYLREPSAVLLKNLAMFPASIVSPKAVQSLREKFAELPVGTGPFAMKRWDRDERIVLSAFEKYWNGTPNVGTVVFIPVRESSTRIEQIRRGEADIADDLPPLEVDALSTTPGVEVQSAVGLNVAYLTMHNEKPPFDRPAVRRAVAMAIDKAKLVKVCYGEQAETAKSLVPKTMWGSAVDMEDIAYEPDLARKQMDELAVKEGWTLPLQIRLCVMSEPRPYMQQPIEVASFIKDSLAKIGITTVVETRDIGSHFDYLMSGKHELALAGWSSDNVDPDNFLYSLLSSANISEYGNNLSRYRNGRVDGLLSAAQRELQPDLRLKMYLEAQRLIRDDTPVVPLVHTRIRVAQRNTVKGYKLHPTALVRLRLARIEK